MCDHDHDDAVMTRDAITALLAGQPTRLGVVYDPTAARVFPHLTRRQCVSADPSEAEIKHEARWLRLSRPGRFHENALDDAITHRGARRRRNSTQRTCSECGAQEPVEAEHQKGRDGKWRCVACAAEQWRASHGLCRR